MNNSKLKIILQALPLPFYVIDCNTYKVVETNHSDLRGEDITCHKLIYGFDKPCNVQDIDRECSCNEVLKQKQKVEIIQKSNIENENKVFKVIANSSTIH
jgi:hypothetical protein